jgi:hypothetical protein
VTSSGAAKIAKSKELQGLLKAITSSQAAQQTKDRR